ncbi:outer membrane protein [Elusimicrobium simillimum]|uniref:TolC family protein n=1 Tax=Elusimicrobium simillimum TaxID=3143438 RepID=UPI003C6FC5EA
MKKYILFAAALALCLPLKGEQYLSLKACEEAALKNAPQLRALASAADAAQLAYDSIKSTMYPTINLEAGGSYTTEVPELEFDLPGFSKKMEFGDNWGYSAGPVLHYTIFDYGARSDQHKSAKLMYESKQQDYEWGKKQVLLSARTAYFKVQQDLERMYLLTSQLEVAGKQLRDVKSAFNAGAKSELDVTMANKQVLSVLSQISAMRAATAADLRSLFEVTLDNFGIDPAYPIDYRIKPTDAIKEGSAALRTDNVDDSLQYFAVYNYFSFDESSPTLLSADRLAEYYEKIASSYTSALWPKITFKAGAYWEYPNGPVIEDVFLGRGSLSLVMPLFEGGRTRSQAKEQRAFAATAQAQKEVTYHNIKTMFDSAKDRLYSIGIERDLAGKIIKDAAKTSDLTYSSYKAGAVTFLEVDNANFRLTESQINLVDLKIENLTRLAVIASLGK